MSTLCLDTNTSCLLFASNLQETPLALNLGNEDTMPQVFSLLEFPSDPLPTTPTLAPPHTNTHPDFLPMSDLRSQNQSGKPHTEGLWPGSASSLELRKRLLTSCPLRTSLLKNNKFIDPNRYGFLKITAMSSWIF